MIFGPDTIWAVLDGSKTVTRRPSTRYRAGRSYAVQPGRNRPQVARIVALDVTTVQLGETSHQEAQLEGFVNVAKFLAYWERLYGSVDLDQLVARIQFRLLEETVRPERIAELRRRDG